MAQIIRSSCADVLKTYAKRPVQTCYSTDKNARDHFEHFNALQNNYKYVLKTLINTLSRISKTSPIFTYDVNPEKNLKILMEVSEIPE